MVWKTKQGKGGLRQKVIVIEKLCEGVSLSVWEVFRGARRWEVGGRVQVC